MGLFSKHKTEDSSAQAPPMPPAPNSDSNNLADMPSAPDMNSKKDSLPDLPSMDSSLKAPSFPTSSLDDIKSQVSPLAQTSNVEQTERENTDVNVEDQGEDNDSLFDMFNVDLPEEIHSEEHEPEVNSKVSNYTPSSSKSLSFTRRSSHNRSVDDMKFLTTSQFKAMLDVVENVKQSVKDSSDIHMRLMDMKSEEDIEYENLRKNFQSIEDKLYELDNILFEK